MKYIKWGYPLASEVLALVCLLFAVHTTVGAIIPSSRLIDWTQSGIPGGIPDRTIIYTNLTGLDGTGATDVTAAIQNALNKCPSNQVVKLPAGTFRINGSLSLPNYVTLRGAGTSTVLTSYGAPAGLVTFGGYTTLWDPTSISTTISSGATAGSTNLVVASASGISAGTALIITEVNDPAFVSGYGTANGTYANNVDGWSTVNTRSRGQIVMVTSVSGTTVGFTPPLYSAYSHVPWATRLTMGCKWAGVEDLKTYANNTGVQRNFLLQQAAYCWVKNVESDYTDGDHVMLDWAYRCEIRHNYFHDSFHHGSGTYDNQVGLWHKTSGCLVVDNIVRRLHTGLIVECGAAGNVIAYNFEEGGYDDSVLTGARACFGGIDANHSAHPQFNLFEGNYISHFSADSYWGTSSDATFLRNYCTGTGVTHPPISARGTEDTNTTYNLIQMNYAVDIWEEQRRYNVVGNVIGDSSLKARSIVRKAVSPAGCAYDNPPYCFTYGYASGARLTGTYENPSLTIIEHGNWDIAGGAVVWDSTISDHNIPNSLFLANKPSWFGNLNWPPVDPNNVSTGMMNKTNIPAGYRYVYGVDPPGAGTAPPQVQGFHVMTNSIPGP